MRIVVVGLRGIPNVQGGVETHCEQLYPRIVKRGHEVFILGRKKFLKQWTPYDFEGCHVVPLSHLTSASMETPLHTLRGVFKAWRLGADVIHFHAIGPALFVPVARVLGMKVVLTHHGMDYKRQKWGVVARWVLRVGERMGARFAHHIISISSEITHQINCIYDRQHIHQIPNGVVLPLLEKEDQVSKEFEALGLGNQRYIFTLGRFVPEKEFHTLIKAWQQLPEGTCRLVIAGAADHTSVYSRKLHETAAHAGVVLPGFIRGSLLHDLFRKASLFVIPSTHEGLPIALLEAMSYDLPILVSDIEPHKEMKLPQDCYFVTGSEESLTDRVLNQLQKNQHPTFRTMLKEKYDWDVIAQQTEEVYQNAQS